MGGLINLIKSLFSGIFSFIGGLFGGKKSDAIEGAKTRKSSGYFLELDDSATPAATSQPAAPTLMAPPPAAPAPQPAAPAATAVKAPEPVSVATAAPAPAATETEFATKYLVPTNTGGRRRPGANMTSYLDMAQGVKSN